MALETCLIEIQRKCFIPVSNELFKENFKDIYPPELQLNLESSWDNITFLDIDLRNVEGRLDFKLFDKRDSFSFE